MESADMRTVGHTFGRSSEPFFHQKSTHGVIAEIAESRSLVIYVGAGATRTESGHSWGSIVDLLIGTIDTTSEGRDRIRRGYDLPKQASIAREYYRRTYAHYATDHMAFVLRRALYNGDSWRGGNYADSIALLCREFVDQGRSVFIVTTNYDQYLELAFSRVLDEDTALLAGSYLLAPPSAPRAQTVLDELGGIDAKVPILHIHGLVLVPNGTRSGVPQDIVLDEADYLATEHQSDIVLTNLFESHDVLILGSSLEDQPLLRALWKSRNGRRRWAIYPRQSLPKESGAYDDEGGAYGNTIRTLEQRMKIFDVQIVAPDFFSQAAQLIREVCVACACSDQGISYDDNRFEYKYSKRLGQWWEDWFGSRCDDLLAAQYQDSARLMTAVRDISKLLDEDQDELKLELWVRWAPSSALRSLKLWASSVGTWTDPNIAREAPIDATSSCPAVEVFCEGAARAKPTDDHHGSWRKYLAVPIRNGDKKSSVQVGVLVLSTSRSTETRLDEAERETLNVLAETILAIGAALMSRREENQQEQQQ